MGQVVDSVRDSEIRGMLPDARFRFVYGREPGPVATDGSETFAEDVFWA